MRDVVLVDYSWLYRRSYHGFTDLFFIQRLAGVEKKYFTGSMYGTVMHCAYLRKKYGCPVYVATEPKSNRERFALRPDYKGNREKSDPAIFELYGESLTALTLYKDMRIISSPADGEADDVINSFILNHVDEYDRFLIFATDKDLIQIAGNPRIPAGKLFYVSLAEPFEIPLEQACAEKFGVTPAQILLYRSIIGDSSDNLKPPVPRFNRDLAKVIVEQCAEPEQIWEQFIPNYRPPKKAMREWLIKLAGQQAAVRSNYDVMRLRHIPVEDITDRHQDASKPISYFWMYYGMAEFVKVWEDINQEKFQVTFI